MTTCGFSPHFARICHSKSVTTSAIKITEFIAFYSPLVVDLVLSAVLAATAFCLLRTHFPNRRWLAASLRLAGALLILPLILLVLRLGGYRSRPRLFVSPDSQHVAEYTYESGFLGRDVTIVAVRRKRSIRPEEAYVYEGPSDWRDTQVHWLNNEQLVIQYASDASRLQNCKAAAAGVSVQCVPVAR